MRQLKPAGDSQAGSFENTVLMSLNCEGVGIGGEASLLSEWKAEDIAHRQDIESHSLIT